ncbi:hypothetical protein COU74_00535 [Candidatus Peregrinibacteria bacterium CG10_big_fil_rev_8_21_14_0_10_36_19]|nr:MAG: hypothetical protein COU74_00535 [Candidatus Peregrinibacteria bacterium CG10_big_fil_rev_8_21_14_0_10_36_19]
MPKFNYVITDDSGRRNEGVVNASTLVEAREKLSGQPGNLISLVEDTSMTTWFWQKPHLSLQDKLMFVKHMSTMIKVGITITEAITILINQTSAPNNQKMYKNILERIRSGQSLSQSLQEYDYVFSNIFINMIGAGEQSGTLPKVLEYLDLQLEKEYELRKKVISAFIYPGVIISVTFLLTIAIVLFVMPKITDIFESFDVTLPLVTRILIGFSKFVTEQTLLFFAIVVGAVSFFVYIFRAKFMKPFWHRVVIYLPVFGKLLVYANLARFARTMSSLLQSGLPVVKALDITGNMLDNHLYKNALKEAAFKVDKGGKIGDSLEGNPRLFPPIATKMIYIGEKTGSLNVTTESLATLYEREVDTITRNLSVLLEPFLLVFMAALIGGIALAIVLPIYQLPSLISK